MKYIFDKYPACPRCGSMDTIAISTQGKVQYRRCRTAICRQNFHVIGKPLKLAGQTEITGKVDTDQGKTD